MARLNKVQIYYIESHASSKTVHEIAEDVGCTVKAVQKVIDALEANKPKPKGVHPSVRDMSTGKGVTIMTPGASTQIDSNRSSKSAPVIRDGVMKIHEGR